jgi:hypothetical protein
MNENEIGGIVVDCAVKTHMSRPYAYWVERWFSTEFW